MKLIRRDTDYAIVTLVHLAQQMDKLPISSTEIARDLEIPHGFLRKILKTLSNNGYVKSLRGKTGGFQLVLKPTEISLLSIFQTFQGEFHVTECPICTRSNICPVNGALGKFEQQLSQELENITIASLLEVTAKSK